MLEGGGECGAVMRAVDWSRTPVGPVSSWPQSLRTMLRVILTSRYPMFLWWGPELVQFYNDGYRPSLGATRHPDAMGKRGREFWTDIWDVIGPEIDGVMASGEPTWHEDALIPIQRDGRLEEVFWTYSYSPVWSEDGTVAGTLVVCSETTEQVRALRRMATLRDLKRRRGRADLRRRGGRGSRARAGPEPVRPPVRPRLPGRRRRDGGGRLAGGRRPGRRDGRRPGLVEPDPTGAPAAGRSRRRWPTAGRSRSPTSPERFGELPGGPWPDPPARALVLPIVPAGHAPAPACSSPA